MTHAFLLLLHATHFCTLQAIAAGALDLVPTFAPSQLVCLAASFGTLHFAHGPLYAAIARQALPGVAALSPQQRADLLLAYAVLVRFLHLSYYSSHPGAGTLALLLAYAFLLQPPWMAQCLSVSSCPRSA